jgi:hypothetical protein
MCIHIHICISCHIEIIEIVEIIETIEIREMREIPCVLHPVVQLRSAICNFEQTDISRVPASASRQFGSTL